MKSRWLAGAILCSSGVAWAAPGALDTTFNGTGTLTTPIGAGNDIGTAVALQPDGKLVVAGHGSGVATYDFGLTRYNSDGTLDTTFDGDGKVTTPIGASNDYANAVVLQPDGKLVVAGYSLDGANIGDFVLVRYNSNGSLDTTFDGDGKVTTSFGASDDFGNAVVLQPDGKIVVTGQSFNGNDWDFAVARYNSDGSLDTTFDGDGKVTTPIEASDDYANAVVLQPDGKMVVAGQSFNGANYDFALARYNSDGSLDATFHGDGKVTTPIGASSDYANAVVLQPDGKLVVAGTSLDALNNGDVALVRYNSDGSLDTTFDGDGKVVTPFLSNDRGYAVALQPDGKIVVAGEAGSDFALARYNSDGSLDTTFDGDGKVITPVGVSVDSARSVVLQPDGRLVAAGASWGASANFDFAAARYIVTDTAWDLAPTAFGFADQSDVALGSTLTSDVITVSGLDAGVKVPLQISGGSYSLNGGAYTSDLGWVQNGDTFVVRHSASSSPSTATNTTLTMGGLAASSNPGLILGGTVSDVFTSTTEAADTTPDAFAFLDQTGVAFNVTITSTAAGISGINVAAPISIADGEYSVGCTGTFTVLAGTVVNGDTVCVRHTAAATYSSAVNTTLTIGSISDVFTSTTVGNAVPDPFSFTDLTGEALNSTVTSSAITVSGTTVAADISVTGGEYSIGCTNSFTTANGTINNGETVCVRHTTASSYSTTVDTTLTIGGVSDIFSSSTLDLDGTPDAFTFIDQTNAAPGAVVVSDPVSITGINGPTAVSVTGGEYSVNCTGDYTATAGTLNEGDSVCVRHTASAMHEATVDTTLTVGGTSDVFSSTTEAPPATSTDTGSNNIGGGGAFDPLMALGALAAYGLRRRRAKHS